MIDSRIAGRLGRPLNLDVSFLHNGILADPFAIRRIDIYRGSTRPENLVTQIPFSDPDDTNYPFPAIKMDVGEFSLKYEVPDDLVPNDVYFDVWHFIPEDIGLTDLDDESYWVTKNGRFYLFDDVWLADSDLQTIKFAFEPLDRVLTRGEIRPIELAIHPLPLYDHNWNLIIPLIPHLNPTITVHTTKGELIEGLSDVSCKLGVRQNANRNSPFVVQCLIDTRTLLRGTYSYFIKMNIRNRVITSNEFYFMVR